MKIRFHITLALTCTLILLFVSPICADTIILKWNYSLPQKKSIAASWHWYGDQVEKQTDGKVKFQYYPLGGLFKAKDTRDNMIAGTADISELSVSTEGLRMPLASISTLPTIVFPDTVAGAIAATDVMAQLVDEFPELAAEFSFWKVIGYQYFISYGLFSKKPIYVPSDIKGMKVRASANHALFVRSVGGGSVNIVPPEMYMALKTGVIDAGIITLSMVGDYKLYEIGKYYTDVYLGRSMFAIIMNKNSWNNLPVSVQKVMDGLVPGMVEKGADEMVANREEGKKVFIDNGGDVIVPSPEQLKEWNIAMGPMEEIWLKDLEDKGLGDVAKRLLKRFKELASEKVKNL